MKAIERRNWVEVSAARMAHNYAAFRSRIGPDTLLAAVVKSNAYGHGMHEVARLSRGYADWLCVNAVEEGVALRGSGEERPILVMGYATPAELPAVVDQDLRMVCYDAGLLNALAPLAQQAGKQVKIHLKAETGTQRQGVSGPVLLALAEQVSSTEGLELEGLYTHFANIEDTTDHSFAERQIARMRACSEELASNGFQLPITHAGCSAATLLFDRTHLNLVRIGISSFGLWPSSETRVACAERGRTPIELRPALTWKTRVAQIKEVPEGEFVGYGCTYRTTRASRIAVLPVGYNEGYVRALSNQAHVLIAGRRAPIRGRICMNMCMADVTDIPAAETHQEVVLLGAQGEETISAEQLAQWSGTIPYEVVTRIDSRLPRLVVD